VPELGVEFHFWGFKGVVLWDLDVHNEGSSFIAGIFRTEDGSLPVADVLSDYASFNLLLVLS